MLIKNWPVYPNGPYWVPSVYDFVQREQLDHVLKGVRP